MTYKCLTLVNWKCNVLSQDQDTYVYHLQLLFFGGIHAMQQRKDVDDAWGQYPELYTTLMYANPGEDKHVQLARKVVDTRIDLPRSHQ